MALVDLISYFSGILPILVFLIFIFKMKKDEVWVIFFYCLYSFANDSLIIYRSNHSLKFSVFLYIFTLLEYLFFSFILYSFLHNTFFKRLIIVLSIVFTIFCLYNILFGRFSKFDSYQASIESILVISYCIFFLYEEMSNPQIPIIYSSFKFWFIIGALVYLSATFFLFIYASDLPDQTRQQYWIINTFGNILKNLFFSISFLMYKRQSTSKLSMQNKYNF
jgi:hypothetical protein